MAGDPAIKGLWAFSGRDGFGREAQVSAKQLPCLQGVQSWTDKPSSWRDYAIFKIRGHGTNGVEMITDLHPLDGSIRTVSVLLHTRRMQSSYQFPRTNVYENGLGCLPKWWLWKSSFKTVWLRVPSLERETLKGGFHCVLHWGDAFFPQTSIAWKTLHLASGFELEQHNPPPTDQHCFSLGRC